MLEKTTLTFYLLHTLHSTLLELGDSNRNFIKQSTDIQSQVFLSTEIQNQCG